jgi:hypothetical protein
MNYLNIKNYLLNLLALKVGLNYFIMVIINVEYYHSHFKCILFNLKHTLRVKIHYFFHY